MRFSPDVVIVALYLGNDISDNFSRVATVQDAVAADLALRGADSFDGPRRLLRKSELYTVFESGVLAKLPSGRDDRRRELVRPQAAAHPGRGRRSLGDHRAAAGPDAGRHGEPGRAVRGDGRAAANAVAQRGGPAAKDCDDDGGRRQRRRDRPGFDDPHGQLAALTARNNLTTSTCSQPMRKADNRVKERLYFRQNAHWTAAGHAVAADELYDFLTEHGMTAGGSQLAVAHSASDRGARDGSRSLRPTPTRAGATQAPAADPADDAREAKADDRQEQQRRRHEVAGVLEPEPEPRSRAGSTAVQASSDGGRSARDGLRRARRAG